MLHSPVSMTPERRAAVEALGTVAHLFAPNLFHHRWVGEWASAYPSARLHVPPGLPQKRPDLRAAHVSVSEPEPAFSGVVDVELVAGFRLNELAFLYRPARTSLLRTWFTTSVVRVAPGPSSTPKPWASTIGLP